jgi:hypothetical protein
MTWLWLILTTAWAGDPCPIPLTFHEFTPEWRDRAADLAGLQSQKTWLGVTYREAGGEVVVTAVIPGSPADRAGLQVDDAIVELGGAPVSTRAEVTASLDAHPDAPVSLTLSRDGASRQGSLARGPADPLFLGLVQATESTDCRSAGVGRLSEAQRAALATGAFDAQRAFRCEDAHQALQGAFHSGDVVMVRGGSRVLLTLPGWKTVCVGVSSTDGASLDEARARALVEELAAPYVKDRHENP